jgi:hydroxymethylglutaryl-CoA lyase
MSDGVHIVEVGPRDGLQNEKTPISVADRIAFVEALIGAGLNSVEVGAFVSPKAIPQMVGSAEVLRGVSHHTNCELPVLVPNEKGYEASQAAGARLIAVFAAASESFSRANINCSIAESIDRFKPVLVPNEKGYEASQAAGARLIAVFAAASESFSRANINCSIAGSIERFKPVLARARADGVRVRGYISTVLGCPYEGEIKPHAVVDVAKVLWDLGCYEISLGDTIGVGTPLKARQLLRAVAGHVPMANLAMHFHDTYGQALANLFAGMEEGCRVIDSAAGGLGGCPYAPGATGNVATEDVVYMLEGMGVATGVDMAKLVAATNVVSGLIGRPPVSRVAAALNAKMRAAK